MTRACNVNCRSVSYPSYEHGESRVLQPQSKSYQKNGCANLMDKGDAHRHRATIRAHRTTAKRTYTLSRASVRLMLTRSLTPPNRPSPPTRALNRLPRIT